MEENYFVHGAIDRDGDTCRVIDEEAKFWTVYKQIGGLSYAVFDCCTRPDAEAAANLLNKLNKNN
ncbi:hypothetical protein LMA04_00495 [Pseudescherichia vulneris]|uniref:hypothetical protein n=1 Tax=Pseudescherichia vulneris TaxID=566 RepID=UPI00227ADB00|nr:hypothetical protein [Pseudescherichia vulneris]WAH52574.1 hypothetical protein LMA04_00495 [Pseudescherichia vulneris]